jgi:very-short-patch-repair endonuclease
MSQQPPPSSKRRGAFKQEQARQLRQSSSDAERKLWRYLRNKQTAGLRFRRQQPIGPYIADFYCAAAKLIIELDGRQHGEEEQQLHDDARTRWLTERGYRVIRFWNGQVMRYPDDTVDLILRAIRESGVPLPEICVPQISTLPQGEG